MTQGLALRCIATGSAYKMIWTAKIEKNSIPALRRHPNHFTCTFSHNITQRKLLRHNYKPALNLLHICTQDNY